MKLFHPLLGSLLFILFGMLMACGTKSEAKQRYVFFLHNRFLEVSDRAAQHPEYGRCEYDAILAAFRTQGFTVVSEIRPARTDARAYAQKLAASIDSLIKSGTAPSDITVVGTSKGCYIARHVSGLVSDTGLNYVIVGCCSEGDSIAFRDIRLHGNILSIYEESDVLGQSCSGLIHQSADVPHFREIVLRTEAAHGFLYKASDLWLHSAIRWASCDYSFAESSAYADSIKAMLSAAGSPPFNGVFLVAQDGATRYFHSSGASGFASGRPLRINDRFRIGSISKQITAVLALRELDRGRLDLNVPIRRYLPELKQSWTDRVTVHQLLTHTHGISEPDMFQPSDLSKLPDSLRFSPGTGFAYSQLGYALLAVITSRVTGRPFEDLAAELFRMCNMTSTGAPRVSEDTVVTGYTLLPGGQRKIEQRRLPLELLAAGGFISTANDLLLWNEQLHNGKLLKESSYRLMMTKEPVAVRNHPVFGPTDYGYGVTIKDKNGPLRLGLTGGVPGFASMCFYYPATKTSVIMLSNQVQDFGTHILKTFHYHTSLLRITEHNDIVRALR